MISHLSLVNDGMNGVEDGSDDEKHEEYKASAMYDGDGHAKSPPSRLLDSINWPTLSSLFGKRTYPKTDILFPVTSNSSPGSVLSCLFKKPTVKYQLPFYACRWPGCQDLVRRDQARMLGGFCCETEMW